MMENKRFKSFYAIVLTIILAASVYPIYMGAKVVADMVMTGSVIKEEYPKYIIPYTPISIAVLLGVLLLPLLVKKCKKHAFLCVAIVSILVFLGTEILFERMMVVKNGEEKVVLQDWQMFMCAAPALKPGKGAISKEPLDILTGNYNPGFKMHFYLISVILILGILNSIYGFAKSFLSDDKKRRKALILQSVAVIEFLGLCILACFTAFFRTGEIRVPTISTVLMSIFFVVFGLTAGIFLGSFLLGKKKIISVGAPAVLAAVTTFLMYIGEAVLLNGRLYQLGTGFLFDRLGGLIFSLYDLLLIVLSAVICAVLLAKCNK